MKPYLAAVLAAVLVADAADASVTVTISEQGGDVVAAVSGDLVGLTSDIKGSLVDQKGINPGGFLETGVYGGLEYNFAGLTGEPMGMELYTPATSASGILFLVDLYDGRLFISDSYVLGTPIISSATWANSSLAALGLNPGVYHYAIGSNDIRFTVGTVPEPAAWAMMLFGLGAAGAAMRRRRAGRTGAA